MIDRDELIRCAKNLHSEDGENPEYDRALVELVREVTPFSRKEVASMLTPPYRRRIKKKRHISRLRHPIMQYLFGWTSILRR